MKILNQINSISVITIALMIGMTACKKKDDSTPAPTYGTLMFHIHSNVDSIEADTYGDTLTMPGGRQIVVNKAQLYLSGIKLVKSDGSTIDGPDINLLTLNNQEQYMVGTVTAGNYQSVKFNVGLSSSTNGSAPSSSNSTLYRKDMWFDSTMAMANNFIFVNFEGMIDTSDAKNGQWASFSYHIGTNSNLKNKTMPDQAFSIPTNGAQEVHMMIDYAELFNGLKLNDSTNLKVNSPADNGTSLATKVAANIPAMFHYE